MAEKKLGDSAIHFKNGGSITIPKSMSEEQRNQLISDAVGAGHSVEEVLDATPEVLAKEEAAEKASKRAAQEAADAYSDFVIQEHLKNNPGAVLRDIKPVGMNGATREQVQQGGTPGTFKGSTFSDVVGNLAETGKDIASQTTGALLNPAKGAEVLYNASGLDKSRQVPDAAKTLPDAAQLPPAAEVPGAGAADMGAMPPSLEGAGPGPEKGYNDGLERAFATIEKNKGEVIQAESKAAAAKDLAAAHADMKATQDAFAAAYINAEAEAAKPLQGIEKQMGEIAARQAKLDPTIDPNRYWHNKSAGQIALGAIAGGLFGFAGQGLNYIKQIQSEVELDTKSQQMSYENASSQLQKELAAKGDEYARARQAGVSKLNAMSMANIAKLSAAEAYVKQVTAQGASQEAMANAQAIGMGLQQSLVEGAAIARKNAQAEGHQNAAEYMAREGLKIQRFQAETQRYSAVEAHADRVAKINAAKGTGAGAKPPAAITKQLQGYDELDRNLTALKDISNGRGVAGKVSRAIESTPYLGTLAGKEVPGWNDMTGLSDAAGENGSIKAIRENLLTGISKASLTKTDAARLDNVLNNINRLGKASDVEIDFLRNLYKQQRQDFVNSNKAYDLSGNSPVADPNGFTEGE